MVRQQDSYINDHHDNIRSILLPPSQFMGDLTRQEQEMVTELKNKYDAMTDKIVMEVCCTISYMFKLMLLISMAWITCTN